MALAIRLSSHETRGRPAANWGLCDYAENGTMLLLLARYPERVNELAAVMGYFTLAKWVLTFASIIVLAVAILGSIVRRKQAMRGSSSRHGSI